MTFIYHYPLIPQELEQSGLVLVIEMAGSRCRDKVLQSRYLTYDNKPEKPGASTFANRPADTITWTAPP
jgi:hypothetical protein